MAEVFFLRDNKTNNLYRISAKDQAAAIKLAEERASTLPIVTHRMPESDGAILQYPNGREVFVSKARSVVDPKQIEELKSGMPEAEQIKRGIQQGVLQEAERKSPFGRMTGPIVAGTQAIGLGAGEFTDEIAGALFGGDSARALRAIQSAQRSERPIETFAAQAGVGLSEGYGLAKRFPKLAQMLIGKPGTDLVGRVGRGLIGGAIAGATSGAIGGAGAAAPDESRVEEGLKGAGIGTLVGAGVGAVSPVVAAAGENIVEYVRRSDLGQIASALGISRPAASIIKDTMESGGNIEAAIANVQKAGDTGMLADAGFAAQALTDAAASLSPTGGQMVRETLSDRAQQVATQLNQTLSQTLGDAEIGPRAAVKKIRDVTKDQRKAAYDKAYYGTNGQANIIDYASPQGEAVLDAIGRIEPEILTQAFKKANARMRDELGREVKQWDVSINDVGDIVRMKELPTAIQLDYLKRGLNSLVEGERDSLTGRLSDDGRLYANLASRLRQAMGDAIPGYNEAVQLGGDTIAEEGAFLLGRNALKPQTEIEDIFEELGDTPSAAQLTAMRLGMQQYIRKVLNDVRAVPSDPEIEARQLDAFLRLTSSQNARDKITAVLGEQAPEMLRQIDEVAQTSLVRSAVNLNSKTAQRQSIERMADEYMQPGILGQFLRGRPINSTQEIVQALTGLTSEYDERQRQQLFNEIAKAMVGQQGEAAVQTLRIIQDAMQGKTISAADNERMVRDITSAIAASARRQAPREIQQ